MTLDQEKRFLKLIDENTGIVYKVIRIYSNSVQDEQDLKQEILYQAWQSFPRYKGDSKFSTWLYKVALNTALTHVKREGKRKENQELTETSNQTLQGETKEVLIRLIRNFNDIEKLVIMLHLDGYSNEEIATISGLKLNHVAVKIYRIKEKLAQKLKKIQA
jgi:RNA polymerase sigma-70 factor (ECF subfamily)